MRLTYSHVQSYEKKYNLIGGNALNNLKKKKKKKKKFMRLLVYAHKNNTKRLEILTICS